MLIGSYEYIEHYKSKTIELLKKVPKSEKLIDFLVNSSFFSDPASQYFHANHPGGLCFHSYNLTMIALSLNKLYKRNIPEQDVILAGVCHDLCKIGSYKLETKWQKDKNNKWESYLTYGNNELPQIQHGPQSLYMLQCVIDVPENVAQAIAWHMGAYNQSDADNKAMGRCIKVNPLVLLIQQADMASAQFFEECYDRDKIPGLNL